MKSVIKLHILSFLGTFLICALAQAQSNEQKALAAKKERLQQQIKEYNRLLQQEKKEKGNVLEEVEVLDRKINMNQELIRVSNQQVNLLNRQINTNSRKIGKLRNELVSLKDDYAKMIQKSYQNKNQQNRVMFLLSADGFWEAYKRLQYMQQYTSYRKKQGESIAAKTKALALLNTDLVSQRKNKEVLLKENKAQKRALQKEIDVQQDLLSSIRKNESKYASLIKNREKEARAIERDIERLIRAEIASSNNTTTAKATSTFALTPEAKALKANFSANKGKLYWPVERGVISQGFGEYRDKVYRNIVKNSNGIKIVTDKGGVARAIFKGEVLNVKTDKNGKKVILIKHGDYISIYYNLASAFVKSGDTVKAKEELGVIYTNGLNNRTELKFYLFQNNKKLNPQQWISPNNAK